MSFRPYFAVESRWPLWLILALTALVYMAALHAPFLHDDYSAIVENETLQYGSFWPSLFSYGHRPVAMAYLFVWVRFFDTSLFGLHLSGLVIHLVNVLLVWRLTHHLLDRDQFPYATWFVTAVFALHPLQSESVSYILQAHMTAMACTFYLGALVLYLEKRYLAFFPILFLGMGVKEVMITAPMAIFFLEWFVISKRLRDIPKKRWLILVGTGLSWCVLPMLMFFHFHTGSLEIAYPMIHYAMTQPYVIARYVGLFFLPFWQNIDHHVLPVTSSSDMRFWLLGTGSLVVLAATWIFFKKKRTALFFLLFLFLYLLPTSLFPLQDVMVEHRMYLSIVPLAFLTYDVGCSLLGTRFVWIAALFVALLVPLTFARNLLYADGAALWEASVQAVPDNPKAKTTLGLHLIRQGNVDQGVDTLVDVIQDHPDYPYAYTSLLPVLEQTKDWAAIATVVPAQHRQGLATARDLALGGKAFWYQNKMNQAEAMFDAALAMKPQNARANYGKGLIARQTPSRWSEAEQLFKKAFEKNPSKIDYGVAYAEMLLAVGKIEEARRIVEQYRRSGHRHRYLVALERKIDAKVPGL